LAAAFLAGCGSSGGSDEATTTEPQVVTTTAAETTTTGGATSTTAAGATTTAGGGTATSTEPANGLKPGDACSLEEGSPDCIDPDGDGEGTYLIGGAACMNDSPDPALCADLDGDGYAGYPDSQ
jgi:hypothetical protein